MKNFITLLATTAATAVVYNVNAQSIDLGKKYVSYERYESAKKALQPLATSSPEANYYFGLAQLNSGDPISAKATFAKYPNDFYNQAGTARVLFSEGKTTEANRLLQAIVDGAKKRDWERYKVAADAITYSKGGNLNDAVSWYKTAKERNDKNADILIGLGDALMKQNTGASNGEATTNFEEALKLGTANSLAYSRLGLLWLNARQYDKALDNYTKAKDADRENPLPYGDLAEVYYRNSKYELAKQNIEEYLKMSDKSLNDQLRYGNILYLSKNYKEAEAKYAELIAAGMGSKYPTLYRGLAFAQYQNDNYPQALSNFDLYRGGVKDASLYTFEDDLYYAYVNAAMAKEDEANASKYNAIATEYFAKAIAREGTEDKMEVYRNIAESYNEAKNWSKVSEWYGNLVKAYPNASANDYFNAGYYAFFAKDFAKAETGLETFNTKFPEENIGWYWLARTKAAQDTEAKEGTAVNAFNTWLAKPLKDGDTRRKEDEIFAYQYLALYNYQKKNKSAAVDYSKKILALDPENTTAKQIIEYFK